MNEQATGASAPPGADTRSTEGTIDLDAPPERVWQALTEARELERWFPLEARVEPGEGGSIWMSWHNEYAGASRILAWDPPTHLRTSWGWGEDAPAQVTDYRIETRDGGTRLRVVTSGFPLDASWDDWVEGTRRGWRFELQSLAEYVDRHPGEDRSVLHLRRRARVSREVGWDALMGPGGLDPAALGGRTFAVEPPVHWAAVTDDPSGGLLRVAVEPCMAEPEARDLTVWLQAWGESRARLTDLEAEWRPLIERRVPDGAWV